MPVGCDSRVWRRRFALALGVAAAPVQLGRPFTSESAELLTTALDLGTEGREHTEEAKGDGNAVTTDATDEEDKDKGVAVVAAERRLLVREDDGDERDGGGGPEKWGALTG